MLSPKRTRQSVLAMRKRAWCSMFDAMDGDYRPFCLAARDLPVDLLVEAVRFWTSRDAQSFAAFCTLHPLAATKLAQRL